MLDKFFDTLANMGIWMRLNDSRTEPPTEEGRVWGAEVGGFKMSLAQKDADSISVLIKNVTDREIRATLPGWLHYLKAEINGSHGEPAPLKSYGKSVLSNSQLAKPVERVFPPGKSLATEIPFKALFDLKPETQYRVHVTCPVPGNPDAPALVAGDIDISQV